MKISPDVTAYINNAPADKKADIERIRKAVQALVPDAEESISYGIPTFKLNKKPVIYYAAYKDHVSLHPASDTMVQAIGTKLAPYRTGKGTLQFTAGQPLTDDLLQEIIRFRLNEVTGG